jgi:hypothetical protein
MRTVLILLPIVLCGCQEKMGVEKRAEELTKAQASAKASVSATASAPDPHEAKYAAARKAIVERAKEHLVALQKLYQGAKPEELKAFRSYFPPTKEGEKEADELAKEAAFTGKNGYSILHFDITGDQLDPQITMGTVSVNARDSARGKERCTSFKLDFKQFGTNDWRRVARRDFAVVPCS